MKDLKAVMEKMQSNMAATNEANQQNELLKKQVSENAKSVIDELFKELKSCYPAWKQAFETRETWSAAKKTWTKAFIENNISNEWQIKAGLEAARKGVNPFWPSVGQFINWCDGPEIDTDEAFNRMINRKPCNDIAEYETRQEVGFRCKQQLSEEKARALFKKVLTRNIQLVRNGELVEYDINPVQVASPEVFRETETEEARNIRLDAEIVVMQANGTRLIGPYKKRYLQTKGG
jgi:hypothetical protein